MSADDRAFRRRLDRQFDAIRSIERVVPDGERHRHGVEDLVAGDWFRLSGHAYRVEAKSEYREGKERWYELELFDATTGEVGNLEWERDDALEVCLNDREVALETLGIDYGQVESMADRESGEIRFGGITYRYDDDYTAHYHRDCGADAERVFVVEFEDAEGENALAVEAWGEAGESPEVQVWIGAYVEPDEIEVVVRAAS